MAAFVLWLLFFLCVVSQRNSSSPHRSQYSFYTAMVGLGSKMTIEQQPGANSLPVVGQPVSLVDSPCVMLEISTGTPIAGVRVVMSLSQSDSLAQLDESSSVQSTDSSGLVCFVLTFLSAHVGV